MCACACAFACMYVRACMHVFMPAQEQKKDSSYTSASLWDCWFMAVLTQFVVSGS